MLVIVWEYRVREGAEHAFESLYGADGAWVDLFRQHAGHLGTELLRDQQPGRYLTIDRWSSEAEYATFLAAAPEPYARIDAQGDALTENERCVGHYQALQASC